MAFSKFLLDGFDKTKGGGEEAWLPSNFLHIKKRLF